MKNTLIFFVLLYFNSINAQNQIELVPSPEEYQAIKLLAEKEKELFDILYKANQTAIDDVYKSLLKVEISNSSGTTFSMNLVKATLDGISAIAERFPVTSVATDLIKDYIEYSNNNQEFAEKQIQAKAFNQITDLLISMNRDNFVDNTVLKEKIIELIEQKYAKQGKQYLKKLNASQKETNNLFSSSSNKYLYIYNNELSIWKQLINNLHQAKSRSGGFLVCEIQTKGCPKVPFNSSEIIPWQLNKNNCINISSAKFTFTAYNQQFESAINDLLYKTKTNFNDLNVPYTLKVYNDDVWYYTNSHFKKDLDNNVIGFSAKVITPLITYDPVLGNKVYQRIIQNVISPLDTIIKRMTELRIGSSFYEGQNLTEIYNKAVK